MQSSCHVLVDLRHGISRTQLRFSYFRVNFWFFDTYQSIENSKCTQLPARKYTFAYKPHPSCYFQIFRSQSVAYTPSNMACHFLWYRFPCQPSLFAPLCSSGEGSALWTLQKWKNHVRGNSITLRSQPKLIMAKNIKLEESMQPDAYTKWTLLSSNSQLTFARSLSVTVGLGELDQTGSHESFACPLKRAMELWRFRPQACSSELKDWI